MDGAWQHCWNDIITLEGRVSQNSISNLCDCYIEGKDRNPFLLFIMACIIIKMGIARGDIISDAECNLEAYTQKHRSRLVNHDIFACAVKQYAKA